MACRRICEACWSHPHLVAGPGRLDTEVMTRLSGQVLLKAGAEGVYCGALPDYGLGFAIKIDDGAKRAVEAAVLALISRFYPEAEGLGPPSRLLNWRGVEVGQMRPTQSLQQALDPLR